MPVRIWKQGTSAYHHWECKSVQPLREKYGDFLKIKHRITTWSSNPTSAYTSKNYEITISKRYPHSNVHWSTIHNSQDTETTKVSIVRCMDKNKWDTDIDTHIHTQWDYYSANKNRRSCLCENTDFEGIMPSEISHKEKDKWFYWYAESKNIKLIKTMSRMVVAEAEGWENGERLIKGYKRSVTR